MQLDLNHPLTDEEHESLRWSARMRDAETNGPVLAAMQRWLWGEPVPTFAEQLATFGMKYADHLYAYRHGDPRQHAKDFSAVFAEREAFVRKFAFAVPNAEALNLLAAHQPLLEIGAGSGAWARLLELRGIDIIATDAMLQDFGHGHGTFSRVRCSSGKAAVRRWSDRDVFCSWPSLQQTWLRQAARAMRPGRYLLVIREDATADERTWTDIERAFEFHGSCDLINWSAMHDRLEVWRKLGPKQRQRVAGRRRYLENPD